VPPIRVVVVGSGAFGRNHLRVYRELELAHPNQVRLTALIDADPNRRTEFSTLYNIPAYASVADFLNPNAPGAGAPDLSHLESGVSTTPKAPADAASICVPTIHHAAIAKQLLAAGLDVLIEKPFAASLAEADRVLDLAAKTNRIVAIGHLERFNPAVTAVADRLNNPMFFEAHRLSIFTPRSLDVDVVLDLMIHDLDIVLSLTNSPIREVRAVGLAILSKKVDIANVRVEFESGCVANFTASRVSTEQVRKLRLFQPHQYLSLDFARQELLSIDVDPRAAAAAMAAASLAASTHATTSPSLAGSSTPTTSSGLSFRSVAEESASPVGSGTIPTPTHPSAGLNLQKLDLPRAEPLRLEIEDFLHAVRTRTQPRVNGQAGRAALSLALEINQEIATHAHRAGLL
jgi:predicted dehydrogenase